MRPGGRKIVAVVGDARVKQRQRAVEAKAIGRAKMSFEFGAIALHRAGVEIDRDEARAARARSERILPDEVFIVVVENCRVDSQAAVERRKFGAELVGPNAVALIN